MHKTGLLGLLLALLVGTPAAQAIGWRKDSSDLLLINHRLAGKVLDFTNNHGKDNRIWSSFLYQRRDLYVYLPPCFKPDEHYPLMIWMHGFAEDEQQFLRDVAPMLDKAITAHIMPPIIVAAPDGSISGEPCLFPSGSFFLNSSVGDFEDFLMQDIWAFMTMHFPIRCERQAHVLAGFSMGGFAAFHHGIKYKQNFGVAAAIAPPLNLRWVDDKGHYGGNFDPCKWGWRDDLGDGRDVLGRFYGGLVTIRMKHLLEPLYGLGQDALATLSQANPIEMIDRCGLHEGELSMFVAYGLRDEYNIDAQVESFVYLARCRGLTVTAVCDPHGRHHVADMLAALPELFRWLGPLLVPYAPSECCACPCCETPHTEDCASSSVLAPHVAQPTTTLPPASCPDGSCSKLPPRW